MKLINKIYFLWKKIASINYIFYLFVVIFFIIPFSFIVYMYGCFVEFYKEVICSVLSYDKYKKVFKEN
jgi:hypothetical protein